jgi:hypothetical protein
MPEAFRSGERSKDEGTMVRTLIAVAVLALAAGVGRAGAAASCSERVVDDWAADTRVDGAYPSACYRRAIESLPEDLRAYSSAVADIQRALQAELASTPATGSAEASPRQGHGHGAQGLLQVLMLLAGVSVVAVLAVARR